MNNFQRILRAALLMAVIQNNVFSQELQSDTSYERQIIKNAVSLYFESLGIQSGLYNGSLYIDNLHNLTSGHQYFESMEFNNGIIYYDGLIYEDVPLLYDIINDEIIVRHPNKIFKIRLLKEKIAEFALLHHRFTRIEKDSTNKGIIQGGFYDLLYNGRLKVYRKQIKTINEKFVANEVKRDPVIVNNYFVKKGEIYYPVGNRHSLLKMLNDKRKEIQRYLSTNHIKYRKNPEYALLKAAAYYDELTH